MWPTGPAFQPAICGGRPNRGGLAPRTVQRRLRSASFFSYLESEGEIGHNPARGVKAPRPPRNLPQTLDLDQVARLLDIPDDDAVACRDRAMLELTYSSGLRLAELTGLDLGGVDMREGLIRVTGKGRKTRILPVGRKALDALKAWMQTRGELRRPGRMHCSWRSGPRPFPAPAQNRTGAARLAVRARRGYPACTHA